MPMVLPSVTYASSPRRWPSSSTPSSASEVPIIPAVGTYVAVSDDDGSRRVTDSNSPMAAILPWVTSAGQRIVLDTFCRSAFGDQRFLRRGHHVGAATDQDLPVAPVSVLRHHLGQPAGLVHMKSAGRLHVGIVGGPRRVLAELRNRRHRQPRVLRRDLPQRG